MIKFISLVIVIGLVYCITICVNGAPPQLKIGDAAQEISVTPVNGNDYEKKYVLSAYKDKVIVLEFWATWCPPCRQTIPHLSKLQEKYSDKVVFIGISDEQIATVVKFYKTQKEMKYRVAVDNSNKTTSIYMGGFAVKGIPHAFIIKNGKIIWHGHPMEIEKDLETAVSGK